MPKVAAHLQFQVSTECVRHRASRTGSFRKAYIEARPLLRCGRESRHGQVLTGMAGCLFCSVAAPRGRTAGPWPLGSERHK